MHNPEILLITLTASVVIVTLLRRLHLPPLLGYLMAGALVGPHCFRLLETREEMSYIAEFGVVFLLFNIGLELSLPKLISMRRPLLGLGGLQVAICTGIALGASLLLGTPLPASIAIAGALALSSTAIATKLLIEQDELQQPHGKLSLSILLFQDLAAVPFLIIIPAMAVTTGGGDSITYTLLQRLLTGTVIFFVMLAAGRWLLRPLFHQIASARSSELFMLTALLIVLASALLTEHFGLSLSLGAFLAGVMLAETEYAHQIESDIQPFRDILLGFFFISVGLMFDPGVFTTQWQALLMIVAATLILKTIIIAILAKIAGSSSSTSIRAGIALAQGGEFGLVFLSKAFGFNLIDANLNQLIIAAVVISMAISPLLIRKSEAIADGLLDVYHKFIPKSESTEQNDDLSTPPKEQANHVIICGYGRVGQTLARFLDYEGIPYVGLDLDPVRLREAKAASEPVFFGDGADEDALKAAGIDKARMVISSSNNTKQAQKTIMNARRLNPNIPILVRTIDDSDLEALQIAGATEVIPDKLESSLMLAKHMLIFLGQTPHKAQQQIHQVKLNRYKMLRTFYEGEKIGHLETNSKEKRSLHTIELTEGSYAIGQSLDEFFAKKGHFEIAYFSRNGFKCDTPALDFILQAGDIIVVEGTHEETYQAEEKLLQG
ncbi:MAG: monovalent cation:proton antiporter-2 (CPA2) family protein [Candidatus Berkiella sp.]